MKIVAIKFKKGDTVKVLSGKDKGKTGKIISVDRKAGRVTVEGINIHHRFQKARGNQPGQKVQFAAALHPSKLMLLDDDKKPTRIGQKMLEDGSKQRIAKSTGKAI